ncbi:MAG TPA: GNAT family N-acetyltransferase [Acidimicrobiia bacterium]|nr:GNAT family N-acetyltransferase [Acidimicrobiia bacterium]
MSDHQPGARLPSESDIGMIESGEAEAYGHVAARAFHDDPAFRYLVPDDARRRRGLPTFFRASIDATAPEGATFVARRGGVAAGVASWVPPGRYPLPAGTQLRQAFGTLRALLHAPRAIPDGVRALVAMDRTHPHDEHWYLALLCVDPAEQSHGYGAALVMRGLERADADGLPAYLETSNPRNLAWYGRFGFVVERELRPWRAGPPLWTMRRPARG